MTMCNNIRMLCYSRSKRVDISDGFAILSVRHKKGPELVGAFPESPGFTGALA